MKRHIAAIAILLTLAGAVHAAKKYKLTIGDQTIEVELEEIVEPEPEPTGPAPLLCFSDLTHAPDGGWPGENKGAAVTVWGRNFGESGIVTANGVECEVAEWNVEHSPFLRRVTFWLRPECADGAGEIVITSNGVRSNPLPLTVIPGRILIATPTEVKSTLYQLQPGDVLYLRDGIYNQKYLTGRHNFYIVDTRIRDGRPDAPIALVAYPGETPAIDALTNGVKGTLDSNFQINKDWWVISKLRCRALAGCLALGAVNGTKGAGLRAVGNDCVGCQVFLTGTAPITTFAGQTKVLGNASHDVITNNKLDHAIYVSGDPSRIEGVEVGWNWCYDNLCASGPVIVINHQDTRIPDGSTCKTHRIHHNLVDCTKHGSRGIGIYHQSYTPGEAQPEPAFVQDNLVIGATMWGVYCVNGVSVWERNILAGCHDAGVLLGDSDVLSVSFRNNTIHMTDGQYLIVNPGSESLRIDGNCWCGLGVPPSADASPVAGALTDPMLTWLKQWGTK